MVSKHMMLIALLRKNNVNSTEELREKLAKEKKKISFSKYADNNFNNLSRKRKNGKWRVAQ